MPDTEDERRDRREGDAADRFAGTAEYYAAYRPGYGAAVVDSLADRYDLDARSRVLDVGCGTGELAVPLADRAGDVVGLDPNEAMLAAARERATAAGVESVSWVQGADADVDAAFGPLTLTTMGRSFHWTDQRPLLDRLRGTTDPGGGVAIVTDTEWFTRGRRDWQAAVYDTAAEYVGDLPERTGPVDEYPGPAWDGLVADAGFADVETVAFEREGTMDADEVAGYVCSLSFCSPAVLGEERADFEAALRARLRERPEEEFVADADVEVIAGRVPRAE